MARSDRMHGPLIEKAGFNEKNNEVIMIAGHRFHHVWKGPETQQFVSRMMRLENFFPMSDVKKIGDKWYSQEIKFSSVKEISSKVEMLADIDIYDFLFRDWDHYKEYSGGLKNVRRSGKRYALFDLQLARLFWHGDPFRYTAQAYRSWLAEAPYKAEVPARKLERMYAYYNSVEGRTNVANLFRSTGQKITDLFIAPPPGKETFNDFYKEFLKRLRTIEKVAREVAVSKRTKE